MNEEQLGKMEKALEKVDPLVEPLCRLIQANIEGDTGTAGAALETLSADLTPFETALLFSQASAAMIAVVSIETGTGVAGVSTLTKVLNVVHSAYAEDIYKAMAGGSHEDSGR